MRPTPTDRQKTLYNRFVQCSRLGVVNRIVEALARKSGKPDRFMIDPTHLGLNCKLHAVSDGLGRPVVLLLSEGQMSVYNRAALTLNALPPAKRLIADRGYDSDWYRQGSACEGHRALHSREPNGPAGLRHQALPPAPLHWKHVRKLKDWHRVAARYDRCATSSFPP